ncbi:MAG TPA: sodium:solute symporter family protein [Candidatus Hydrogenedentes bacterium]|mgnify:CR=1 FL=1|nr:MAG: Sodium/proline symporter [Candidatus Hydrogenedentes bacterium ADurb.Bin179]HOH29609.1 sodium:solute symporter family protein [Candidatus Hydrogenedentota bacterium]
MSNFTWIDGSIVGVYLLATMAAGIMVRKYVGRVETFLVAGREMNVYLGIASLASTEFGIVTCMYTAQNGFDKGFAGATPGILFGLAYVIIGWTGFCIKPMRRSGVMTLPELFESKFGARIRWLSGLVIILSGLLNMGVYLRMGGEFLISVAGISPGGHTLEIMMSVLLISVAAYTILGGMLSVLVTDFLQFIVMSAGMILVTVLIILRVGWGTLLETVETHYGAGGFNPFLNADMGWSFVLFNGLVVTACVLTHQPVIQRVFAAKDERTGQRVFTRTSFFFVCRFMIPGIWGIAALAMLPAEAIGENTRAAMPMFLATILPVGLMGILVASMLAADMSTDSSYLLAYGSVIYNDLLGPLRKRLGLTDRQGILWNRLIVASLGIFFLFYGLWYPLKGSVWSYLTITATIGFASMTTLLISCCYWKRANSHGAAAAILVGALIPLAYLILELIPATQHLALKIGPNWSGIAAFAGSALAMISGSLLTQRQNVSREVSS